MKSNGVHLLFCYSSAGCFPSQKIINGIEKRALDTMDIHSVLESVGLDPGNRQSPYYLTVFPYFQVKAFVSDAACMDSFYESNMIDTAANPGYADIIAEEIKHWEYAGLVEEDISVTIAVTASGIMHPVVSSLLHDISGCMSQDANNPWQTNFLFLFVIGNCAQ